MCITKETTLKGIRVSNVKLNNCIFADQRSDTFCTAHVYLTVTAKNKVCPLRKFHFAPDIANTIYIQGKQQHTIIITLTNALT